MGVGGAQGHPQGHDKGCAESLIDIVCGVYIFFNLPSYDSCKRRDAWGGGSLQDDVLFEEQHPVWPPLHGFVYVSLRAESKEEEQRCT